jgi:NTE family protein
MMNRLHIIIPLIVLVMSAHTPVSGQVRPRVGLALSGGAARGFMHVGVIKVLEEVGVPIDCIAGTSMGAVVGGLYASGYTSAEIESLAVHVDWDDLFSDAVGRSKLAMEYKRWDARYATTFPMDGWRPELPSGLVAGQKITKLFDRLTLPVQGVHEFAHLPIPFVCVATDIETGEAVPLKSGDLADAIRASMAIPSVFTPVVIDDRLLVDGGVVRNLPAEDARALGADIVIGVEASEPLYKRGELKSMVRIMEQAIHFQISGTSREQRKLCDILIVPETEKSGVQFDEAAYFISRGEAAAREMLPRLQALADSLHARSRPETHARPVRTDSTFVTSVTIEGLQKVPSRVVETELKIVPPLWMSIDDIDNAVDRLYKYDYFERVGYAVEPSGEGSRLRFRVVEKSGNLFRAGLRYDSDTHLALLLNLTLRNLGVPGSALAWDIRVGDDYGTDIRYFFPVGRTLPSFGLMARANATRTSIDVYAEGEPTSGYQTTYSFGELLAGTLFASRLAVEVGVRGEYIRSGVEFGFPPIGLTDRSQVLVPFFGRIRIDTIDHTLFPTKGLFLDLVAEAVSASAGSDETFTRYGANWWIAVPLHRTLSLYQMLYVGTTVAGESPPVYQFFLGGIHTPYTYLGPDNTFLGLERRESAGRHIQEFGLGLQWECYRRIYLLLRGNIGNTFDEWNTEFQWDRFVRGGGLTLGVDLPVAPVEITVMGSNVHDIMGYLGVGYTF